VCRRGAEPPGQWKWTGCRSESAGGRRVVGMEADLNAYPQKHETRIERIERIERKWLAL
jgi:hypothetical protein